MEGEIEDYITFQADCLPTSSISFGRFEAESLSWERRSSFSHNRYLEEVEKYSTPGSVTQKKAYFEAHFKKKALLHQASSEGENGAECQSTENGNEDNMYMEEFFDHVDGGQLQFAWYDETPAVSDDHENEMECGQEELSPYEIRNTPVPCIDKKLESNNELVEHDETLQTQSGCDTMLSDMDDSNIVEQKPETEAAELLEKSDISSKSPTAEKDNALSLKKAQKTSLRVKATVEQKNTKTKLRTQVPVAQIPRKTSTEKNSLSSGKVFTKTSTKMDRENILRRKKEKQSPVRVSSSTLSDSKILKTEDSENLKAKVSQEIKSEKGLRAKKGAAIAQSTSEKGGIDVCQYANRGKRVINSAKADLKQSSVVFTLKSDERAEKRKEFFMRLEEKLHAKEAEMNEIQAKSQEETEAEIKQFRRSLNFKATPMPSFYHEAVARVPDGKKTVVASVKSTKSRNKCTSPGCTSAPKENSPAFFKAANREGPYMSEPTSSSQVERPSSSEGDTGFSVPANGPDKADEFRDTNPSSQSAKKIEALGKKEERGKLNVQQQRGEGKVKKVESASKVKRSGVGKVMKGIVGGNLTVHVAS